MIASSLIEFISRCTPSRDLKALFTTYRRFMLGLISDPTVAMLAIVLTGLEEVVSRSTMVHRDNIFRWIQDLPEATDEEEQLQKRFWAASVASAMYHEFSSIIVCRLAYMVMRPHRFIFNLGYMPGDDGGTITTSLAMLLSTMFLELAFEFVVDNITVQIESGHGIYLRVFWDMWRKAPYAFWGMHVCQSCTAFLMVRHSIVHMTRFCSVQTLSSPLYCTIFRLSKR